MPCGFGLRLAAQPRKRWTTRAEVTRRLALLCEAIRREPNRDWSVATMAKLAHLSRAHFCREFGILMGESPSRFVRRVRIEAYTKKISEGKTRQQAAWTSGYSSARAARRAKARI